MIDHHVHLGKDSETGFSLDSDILSMRLDRFMLKNAVIFSCPNQEDISDLYKKANQKILVASCKDKRFIPFMFVHPDISSCPDKDFFGFKFHPRAKGLEYDYKSIEKDDIVQAIINSPKPIIFHTGYREGTRIRDLEWCLKKRKNPTLLTHCGDLIKEDLEIAERHDSVYLDVSPMATMLKKGFYAKNENRPLELNDLTPSSILSYLDNKFGKERILWGSDSPWSDNLISAGYLEEIRILELMVDKGFKNSLPL